MKLLRILVGTSALCCSLLLSSCGGGANVDDSGCGSTPNPPQRLITGYSASLARYDKPIDPLVLQAAKPLANNDSPVWNAFSIELTAAYQLYQSKAVPSISFSLFAQAFACSLVLGAKQHVTKISITSANNFSDKYPAGSELLGVFESINHTYIKLTDLLVNSRAPLQLSLKLLEAPQYARQNFEIKITLDDGNTYVVSTGDVYFNLP
ncbi:hypothetical protein GCM10011613_00370 [Cellvibrio zantedeschiae]|uniref:Lipoprotein n=1 Tax=Cellvibrio zantedeschiae TaxID=1237077 RepID=A0ABQ3AMG4_9GAMM|nr:DUF5034 domain-containing protein [Cellvibrio zantedeschiae]GGY60975.1 hypothetical protein GCM10011613_00370 [Cellvibrio zantedeschiae]